MIVNKYGRRIYQQFLKTRMFELITPKIKKIFYDMCKYYDFEGADVDSIELFTLEDSKEDLEYKKDLDEDAKDYFNEYSVDQATCGCSCDSYYGTITMKVARNTYLKFDYSC